MIELGLFRGRECVALGGRQYLFTFASIVGTNHAMLDPEVPWLGKPSITRPRSFLSFPGYKWI